MMDSIRDFLRANANLDNQIRQIAEEKRESIRIAAYASIAMHWMPELLYRFKRLCPEVNVDLRMVDHALEPFELLESGQTDVIFFKILLFLLALHILTPFPFRILAERLSQLPIRLR